MKKFYMVHYQLNEGKWWNRLAYTLFVVIATTITVLALWNEEFYGPPMSDVGAIEVTYIDGTLINPTNPPDEVVKCRLTYNDIVDNSDYLTKDRLGTVRSLSESGMWLTEISSNCGFSARSVNYKIVTGVSYPIQIIHAEADGAWPVVPQRSCGSKDLRPNIEHLVSQNSESPSLAEILTIDTKSLTSCYLGNKAFCREISPKEIWGLRNELFSRCSRYFNPGLAMERRERDGMCWSAKQTDIDLYIEKILYPANLAEVDTYARLQMAEASGKWNLHRSTRNVPFLERWNFQNDLGFVLTLLFLPFFAYLLLVHVLYRLILVLYHLVRFGTIPK